MAKVTQQGRAMYESAQVATDGIATPVYGGEAPTHVDIIKSANARGQRRHEMKNDQLADVGVLPDSSGVEGNEMVGVKDSGYLTKKGLEFGVNSMTFSLPPGMDIEDQENSDIREMALHNYGGGISYPTDGWRK